MELPPASAPVSPTTPVDPLLDLAPWQRKYCLALQAGLTQAQAEIAANVTRATICDYLYEGHRAYSPRFARAEEMARHGAVVIGREQVRADTLAQAYVAKDDAFKESRGLDPTTGEKAREPIVSFRTGEPVIIGYRDSIRAQDRVANRRLVLETAGAIGQGAQVQVAAGVRVQITVPSWNGAPLHTMDTATVAVSGSDNAALEPSETAIQRVQLPTKESNGGDTPAP